MRTIIKTGSACVFLLGFVLAALAQAPGRPAFNFEREVRPGGKGANRLAVDVGLLSGAASPILSDLRLYDNRGREAPYLLVPPLSPAPRWRDGRILPVAATKNTSGFEVDVGQAMLTDRLRLAGIRAPFLKRFGLEGSGDRAHWTLLVAEGTLFDLPEERLRQTETGFPAGEYRYFRVTWDDRRSGRVQPPALPSARFAEPLALPPPLRWPAEFQRLPSEPGRSRFQVRLPGRRLPVAALELDVAPGHLLRPARVLEARLSGDKITPLTLGSATLRRAEQGGLVAADLRIPTGPPEGRELDLVVDDGNNPTLALLGVSIEFAPLPWIYFESGAGETLAARFGNDSLSAPRYDLEAMREQLPRVRTAEANWGETRRLLPQEAAEVSPLPPLGAPINTSEFRYSRKIAGAAPGLASVRLDAAVLAHSNPGLEDLRIAGAEGRQVPYLLERRDEPLSLDLLLGSPRAAPPPGGDRRRERQTGAQPPDHRSRYALTLPYAGLPASQLVLTATARVFQRSVSVEISRPVEDPRSEPTVQTLADADWRHADPDTAAPLLVLNLPRLETAEVTLVIDEGDNAPLPVSSVRLLLPSHRLRFFHPAGAKLRLLYGLPRLAPPRYDIALLAPRLVGVSGTELPLAPEEGGAAAAAPFPAQKIIFWGVLVAAVLILLVLLLRLLRTEETTASTPGSAASPETPPDAR
jgi:hypothetical protein